MKWWIDSSSASLCKKRSAQVTQTLSSPSYRALGLGKIPSFGLSGQIDQVSSFASLQGWSIISSFRKQPEGGRRSSRGREGAMIICWAVIFKTCSGTVPWLQRSCSITSQLRTTSLNQSIPLDFFGTWILEIAEQVVFEAVPEKVQ